MKIQYGKAQEIVMASDHTEEFSHAWDANQRRIRAERLSADAADAKTQKTLAQIAKLLGVDDPTDGAALNEAFSTLLATAGVVVPSPSTQQVEDPEQSAVEHPLVTNSAPWSHPSDRRDGNIASLERHHGPAKK